MMKASPRGIRVIHTVSAKPFDRPGSVFREMTLPDGTIVRMMDRAVFERACAAAGGKIKESLERLKTLCPS